MAKILVPFNPRESLDLNQDGQVTVDELIKSATWIFLAGLLILGSLIIGLWVIIDETLPPWRVFGVILIIDSLLTGALIGYRMTYPERNERELAKDREFERKRAQWEFDQARGVSEDARSSSLAQADIDVAAMQILRRHYAGKPFTRDAMVGDGIVTAQLWNEANGLLKKRGIRAGRKNEFRPDTFAEAWAQYCEHKLKANQHYVKNGDWTEKV